METTTGAGDRRWLTLWAFPILSGLILAAAFPPLPVGFLAYLGLIPLLLAAERLQGKSAYGAGFLQGLVFYCATLYWISWITPMGAVGAILYMSAFRGLTVLALSAVIRRFGALGMWAAPLLFVAFEYFNSLGDLGFPWLAPWPPWPSGCELRRPGSISASMLLSGRKSPSPTSSPPSLCRAKKTLWHHPLGIALPVYKRGRTGRRRNSYFRGRKV